MYLEDTQNKQWIRYCNNVDTECFTTKNLHLITEIRHIYSGDQNLISLFKCRDLLTFFMSKDPNFSGKVNTVSLSTLAFFRLILTMFVF